MPATKYSFNVEQGATLTFSIQKVDENGNPISLSLYDTAALQIRSDYADIPDNILYTTLTASLSANQSNTGIYLDTGSNTINVFFSAETTEKFTFNRALYDLELYRGDTVERLLEGRVIVSKEVTRI